MKKRIWSALLAFCIVLSLLPIGALAAEQTVRVGAGQKAGSALSSRPTTGYGIDVSHHQDVIDWNQVKGNIAFAIIRCGYGDDLTSQDDRQFQRNAAACEELGIPYGIYFYSYAEDDTHMQSEISHALRLLQGRKPTLPVYLDLEESSIAALGNAVILRHARAFCTAVANAGFRPGVYANYNWWTNYLTSSEYNQWSRWIARYDVTDPGYSGDYDFWQYSSKGHVAGISGYVDLDYSYIEITPQSCTHYFIMSQELAATCTADGFIRYICSLCGDSYTQTIPAQGHSYENGVCIRCGEADPSIEPVPANPFTDVPEGKFYYDPVLWAISQDPVITTGVTPTAFRPDQTCTRAQVVSFLWRARGCPEPTITRNPFVDVKSTDYFYKAVLWAAENGITTGKTTTTFDPNGECTRAHVITFLWRVEGKPTPSSGSIPFTDVPAGKYYTTAVLWALQKGITTGRTATTFGPDDACTRGHVVTFLYRDMA